MRWKCANQTHIWHTCVDNTCMHKKDINAGTYCTNTHSVMYSCRSSSSKVVSPCTQRPHWTRRRKLNKLNLQIQFVIMMFLFSCFLQWVTLYVWHKREKQPRTSGGKTGVIMMIISLTCLCVNQFAIEAVSRLLRPSWQFECSCSTNSSASVVKSQWKEA